MPGMPAGVINLDKPAQHSSARLVTIVKRQLLPPGIKVGHAGTLDPFATGVLLVLVGKATKRCEELMHGAKEYLAQIRLGATTSTLDPDSPEILDPAAAPVSRKVLEAALRPFAGEITQMPPVYSALKICGQPAYKLAREGKEVKLEPRRVMIHALELQRYEWPVVELRVACGRGTYVRSLARDIAGALGTTGYLTALRRTQVGPFRIEEAVSLERLREDGVEKHLQ